MLFLIHEWILHSLNEIGQKLLKLFFWHLLRVMEEITALNVPILTKHEVESGNLFEKLHLPSIVVDQVFTVLFKWFLDEFQFRIDFCLQQFSGFLGRSAYSSSLLALSWLKVIEGKTMDV